MAFLSEVQQKIEGFCDVFPPGIDNVVSFVVNLPIVLLLIITLPPRTFLCILTSFTEIPLYGVLANLFPPITLFCSLAQESANNACFSNCPYCYQSGECVGIPSVYSNFCQKALPYFSLFDQIFCLVGYIILVLIIPITSLINIALAPLGKQLCINVNPNNCIPPGEWDGL
jgi:hypothetical protein